MKRILLASVVVLIAAGGAGGWYIFQHRDPLQQAKALLQNGDYRGANLQLRTAVRDQPQNAEAHALLSQLQLAADDPIAAEREIKQAMALHWDQAGALAVLSQAYMRQSKWQSILDEVPAKGATPEQTAYFLMTRAVAMRGLKDVAGANATLAEAERIAPQNAEIHLVSARFAIADERPDEAMNEVERCLALEPGRADALQLKARLLSAKGDRSGAIAALTRGIEAAPARSDLPLERAGLLLSENQDAKAGADVDAVLARDPKNPTAQFMHMVLLVRQGKFPDADVVLQRLDPLLANFQRGLYFKAMVKASVGQNAQAEDAILSYINRNPADPDGARLLARIELTSGHPGRAIPYLLRAVQSGSKDPELLNLLGRAYAADGKEGEAEKIFQQASATSQNPAQLAQLASARLQMGDLAGAATDLQRSLQMSPDQAGAGEALVATAIRLGELDRAQKALEQLRQQVGDTEAVGNLSGVLKLARLDPQGALAEFTATATKFPDSIPARLNEAKVLLQLNRPVDAIPVLQSVLEKQPAQAEALALLSQTLLAQNRGPEAVAAAERARKLEPNNLGLVQGEAQIYSRMKDYDKALQVLDSAKVNGNTPVQLLPILGSVQLAAGQNEAAKRTFADLVAAEPNNVGAVLTDIELLSRLKEYDAARHVADDGLARQPGNWPLLQARVRIELQDKGIDAGLQEADRLRALPGNMPGAAALRGSVLMGGQRFKEAAAAFGDEYRKEPSSSLVIAWAQAMQAAGDTAGADAELRRWQASHPDDVLVAQGLAGSDLAAKRYDAAERNLEVVLKGRPNDVIALNNMAWLYQQRGDKRARDYAQRAFQEAPTPEVSDTLGWILASQGDPGKALPLLQGASSARPDNPVMRYHLAVALADLNRRDEAVGVLKPVLESPAQFDERPAAQDLLGQLTKAKP